jgi:tRNA threonylcarbamoyladenosine biosynthesis protein TsaE
MKTLVSLTLRELEDLQKFALTVNEHVPKGSTILLAGDLAAGKTSFVAAFCKLHNISEVSSPTYSIHNRYKYGEITADHFDLYRLENEEQMESSGFFDLCRNDVTYRFIEWPERAQGIENMFAENLFKLNIFKITENERKAELIKIS